MKIELYTTINYFKFINIEECEIIREANEQARDIFERATGDWIKISSKMIDYHKDGYI